MLSIVVDDKEQSGLELDLDALVREGARRMLMTALKAEVDAYIEAHAGERDGKGHAQVVRNGAPHPRRVTTAACELEIEAPRVNDRREGCRFSSAILPPWARRSPKVSEVLPVLYLRGVSTKDFVPALAEFFGSEAGLSASTVRRLTREWSWWRWATATGSRRTPGPRCCAISSGAVQPKAKAALHEIMKAENKEAADAAMDRFQETYGAKYPKATEKLLREREVLLTHFEYPAEHWVHLLSTNAIESTFATVRLRTKKTKGAGSGSAGLAMAYKLLEAAQDRWRAVNAPHLVALVRAGATFVDGIRVEREDQRNVA